MRFLAGTALALAVASQLLAGEAVGRLVASKEPGWPQWRGPRRDGICDETGLLQSWPDGGPKLLWTASGLAKGYSSPIIARGTLYITGDAGDELRIFALDLDGKLKWTGKNGASWKRSYPGARASCAYDDGGCPPNGGQLGSLPAAGKLHPLAASGRIFHMNAHGRVACLDAATGQEVWAVDTLERFQGKTIFWGLSECLLVDGPRVIVVPGGRKALVAALDKKTGETVWASEPLPFERAERFGGGSLPSPVREFDSAGYASPILFELGGRRHIVGYASRHAFGADADTGKLLWTFPMPTTWEVLASMPALYKDAVFVTGPDGRGGKLLRVHVEREPVAGDGRGVRVEEVWTSEMDTCHGSVVFVGDRLYGSWYRHFNGLGCVDAETGKTLYKTNALVKGSILYADGRLYYLSERGVMALLKPTAAGFEFAGRFSLTDGRRSDVWAHPVIFDGRLYLRYHDDLRCYDIKRTAP